MSTTLHAGNSEMDIALKKEDMHKFCNHFAPELNPIILRNQLILGILVRDQIISYEQSEDIKKNLCQLTDIMREKDAECLPAFIEALSSTAGHVKFIGRMNKFHQELRDKRRPPEEDAKNIKPSDPFIPVKPKTAQVVPNPKIADNTTRGLLLCVQLKKMSRKHPKRWMWCKWIIGCTVVVLLGAFAGGLYAALSTKPVQTPGSNETREMKNSSVNDNEISTVDSTTRILDVLAGNLTTPSSTQLPAQSTTRFSTTTISPTGYLAPEEQLYYRKIIVRNPIYPWPCYAPAHVHFISEYFINWIRLQIGCLDQEVGIVEFSGEMEMGSWYYLRERFKHAHSIIINGLSIYWDESTDKESFLKEQLEFKELTNLTISNNSKIIQPELFKAISNARFPKLKNLAFGDTQMTTDIIHEIQDIIVISKRLELLTFRLVQQAQPDMGFFTKEFCDSLLSRTKIIVELPSRSHFLNDIKYLNFVNDLYKHRNCYRKTKIVYLSNS